MRQLIRNILHEYTQKRPKNGVLVVKEEFEAEKKKVEFLVNKSKIRLGKVYKEVTGKDLELPKIEIKIDPTIKNGKIGGFSHPDDGCIECNGVLGIKPKALDNLDYLEDVIVHELIHASIGEDLPTHKEHSGLFQLLADKMGLPHERRD